jgi:hypothetical protein
VQKQECLTHKYQTALRSELLVGFPSVTLKIQKVFFRNREIPNSEEARGFQQQNDQSLRERELQALGRSTQKVKARATNRKRTQEEDD